MGSPMSVADAITGVRVVFSPALPLVVARPAVFVTVVSVCAASDVLDGLVARRTGTAGPRGARLDSWADVLMFLALVLALLRGAWDVVAALGPLAVAVAALRVLGIAVGVLRYRRFVLLHTWADKAAGGLLLLGVPLAVVAGEAGVLVVALVVSIVAALEDLALHLTSAEPDLDRGSLLVR